MQKTKWQQFEEFLEGGGVGPYNLLWSLVMVRLGPWSLDCGMGGSGLQLVTPCARSAAAEIGWQLGGLNVCLSSQPQPPSPPTPYHTTCGLIGIL